MHHTKKYDVTYVKISVQDKGYTFPILFFQKVFVLSNNFFERVKPISSQVQILKNVHRRKLEKLR